MKVLSFALIGLGLYLSCTLYSFRGMPASNPGAGHAFDQMIAASETLSKVRSVASNEFQSTQDHTFKDIVNGLDYSISKISGATHTLTEIRLLDKLGLISLVAGSCLLTYLTTKE